MPVGLYQLFPGSACPNRFCVAQVESADDGTLTFVGLQDGKMMLLLHDAATPSVVSHRCTRRDEDLVALTAWRNSAGDVMLATLSAPQATTGARLAVWTYDAALRHVAEQCSLTLPSLQPVALFRCAVEDALFVSSFPENATATTLSRFEVRPNGALEDTTNATDVSVLIAVSKVAPRSPLVALRAAGGSALCGGFLDGTVCHYHPTEMDATWVRRVCGPVADMVVLHREGEAYLCVADGVSEVTYFGPLGAPSSSSSPSLERPQLRSFVVQEKHSTQEAHVVAPDSRSPSARSIPDSQNLLRSGGSLPVSGGSLPLPGGSSNQSLGLSVAVPTEFFETSISEGPLSLEVVDVNGDGLEELLVGTVAGSCAVVRAQSRVDGGLALRVEQTLSLPSQALAIKRSVSASGVDVEVYFLGPWMAVGWKRVIST